jgi:sugar/nucleoside kinase (ribokinase family)
MPVRIAGAGCCLMDLLFPSVDFSSPAFLAARSLREGDGGLSPGRLVFAEDAERFTGRPFDETLRGILGPGSAAAAGAAGATAAGAASAGAASAGAVVAATARNIGGPSVVSLIHAAQMLEGEGIAVAFYGATGDDEIGHELRERLSRTPLDASRLETKPGRTPSTFVLSDPNWDGGRGERCFVNEIGAAGDYRPANLGEDFFGSDIVALGGTALVPRLHEGLPGILAAARARGVLTVVNTVFDFRAESRDGRGPWPLGGPLPPSGRLPRRGAAGSREPGPLEAYRACDLLVMDRDEALRLSGEVDLGAALAFFERSGVGAFAITRGPETVLAWAGEGRFSPMALREMPVSARPYGVGRPGRGAARGDTTGCGDAFVGGMLAAAAAQLKSGAAALDLADALSWGIAAGAFTLGILGGTYYEARPGEKREAVASLRDDWLSRVGGA